VDQVDDINLNYLLTPYVKNERGETVTAGCGDPHPEWKGTIMLLYMFADYSKYQQEVESTL
jgi:hypothetical protein